MNPPLPLSDNDWPSRWLYHENDADPLLHRVSDAVWQDRDDKVNAVGTTCCGMTGEMCMPGFDGRMNAPRCPTCCVVAGIPEGVGNPYNQGIRESS